MRWIPYGPQAVLVYFADEAGEEAFRRGRAVAAYLERHPPGGMREFVTSFTSVLLEFLPGQPFSGEDVVAHLREALGGAALPARHKILRVVYDGVDLSRVADHAGLSVGEVIDRHAGVEYRVYSLGFAPGFPYLGDLDPQLHTPRLAAPRKSIPAGSVAIGGAQTGIYPMEGPGGWNLIGRTDAALFLPEAAGEKRFLLRQGDLVRFEPIISQISA